MPTPHDHQDIRVESGGDTNDVGGVYVSTVGGWRGGSHREGPAPGTSSTSAPFESSSSIKYEDNRHGQSIPMGEVWWRTRIEHLPQSSTVTVTRSCDPSGALGSPSASAGTTPSTYVVRSSNGIQLTVEIVATGLGAHRWRPITDMGTSESRFLTLVLETDRGGLKVLSCTLHAVMETTKPTS